MEWNAQQDAALLAVDRWLKDPNGSQVFRLFGFAGTGKTTLARHLAEGVSSVFFAAFTGKAALVLKQKGCPNSSTIHSLIYRCKGPRGDSNLNALREMLKTERAKENASLDVINQIGQAIYKEETEANQPRFALSETSPLKWADLLVVDEASMVGQKLGEDLASFGCRILALGDPFQLPPVRASAYFNPAKPDVMLTDVERQARENPVLWLATRVRSGRTLELGTYGDSQVVSRQSLLENPELATSADQILVGRNKTRHASNARMRTLHGLEGPLPVEGDRVVCLRNNNQLEILNGSLWDVLEDSQEYGDLCTLIAREQAGERLLETAAWTAPFRGERINLPWCEACEAEEFDFGWALTVHKSQGSQWDRVLLVDESAAFTQDAGRHLYTGVTRAAQKIVVAV